MKNIYFLKEHRTWEDWLGIGLGCVLILSPWLAGETAVNSATFNAYGIGLLLVVIAFMELFDQQRWEESLECALGVWMLVSPFIFGYAGSGQLRFWHVAIGGIVTALAVLELYQPSQPAPDRGRPGTLT
jgi:hypothetical protein